MKVPDKMRTNCPHCNKHEIHNVKLNRKGRERSMSQGRRKYSAIKMGYGGSPRCPKKPCFKIGKRTVLVLECGDCKKKHQKVYTDRTKKVAEVQ